MNPSSIEQTLETIKAMRRQEEQHYGQSVTDYLSELPTIATSSLDSAPVDESCRSVMGKWCNDIADFCAYKRETVAVAMNCLDRFMSTPIGQQEILLDRNAYQLAAMTALYSSVKIHEMEAMDPKLVSRLSRGVHTTAAVEAMEVTMLNAISWRVNVPTAMSFTRLIINELILPDHHLLSPCEKETIIDLTRIQLELTIMEYDFSTVNASSIAFACMLNAFESCSYDNLANFETTMRKILQVDKECIQNLRVAIYELLNDGDNSDIDNNSSICQKLRNKNNSNMDLSCADDDDVITTTGENNKNESFHSSPRAVSFI